MVSGNPYSGLLRALGGLGGAHPGWMLAEVASPPPGLSVRINGELFGGPVLALLGGAAPGAGIPEGIAWDWAREIFELRPGDLVAVAPNGDMTEFLVFGKAARGSG
jgi:hypothetical protein